MEVRFVDYKGKRVLYRAHVPILNVKYDSDACGPYRDWQGTDLTLYAMGGPMIASGEREHEPLKLAGRQTSYYTGMVAALATAVSPPGLSGSSSAPARSRVVARSACAPSSRTSCAPRRSARAPA